MLLKLIRKKTTTVVELDDRDICVPPVKGTKADDTADADAAGVVDVEVVDVHVEVVDGVVAVGTILVNAVGRLADRDAGADS